MSDGEVRFRFVDLFAGLGGFHVALRGLGGEGVFAAEWDEPLNILYQRNFRLPAEKVWKDVNSLRDRDTIAEKIPAHEVLTAGFPCQPFSKAGEQLGFEHTKQGQLFFRVLDILKEKQPRRFILENVPNILHHRNGDTKKTILRHLRDAGYQVDVKTYSPHEFGIPQIRERAYFVGSLDQWGDRFPWPDPEPHQTNIASVLDLKATAARPIPAQTLQAIDMWNDFLHRSPEGVKLPSFPIWAMEFRATYPYEDATPPALWDEKGPRELDSYLGNFGFELRGRTREQQYNLLPSHSRRPGDYAFPHWKQMFIRQNREFFWANQKWIAPWLEKWKPWEFPSSLQKFEWNAQGEVRDIDRYVLQVRASGIRVKRPHTAPSLIAMTHTQVPILGRNLVGVRRYMTANECAKLQSLAGIQLPNSDLHAYQALGNAVNAEVVKAIAEPLLRDLPRVGESTDSVRSEAA